MTQSTLQEKLNKILVDIVSVTDDIRREQLQEEYVEIEAALIVEKEFTELQSYQSLYKTCSLSEALEQSNNINVSEICKNYKLRPLTTLDNTRLLAPFLSACNATLVIKDMEGMVVDKIGKGDKEYTVYIFCLLKYNLNMTTCLKI